MSKKTFLSLHYLYRSLWKAKTFPSSKMINQEMRHQKQKLWNFCFFVFLSFVGLFGGVSDTKSVLWLPLSHPNLDHWQPQSFSFFSPCFWANFLKSRIRGCSFILLSFHPRHLILRKKYSTILYFRPFCFLAVFISIIYYFLKIFNIEHFKTK